MSDNKIIELSPEGSILLGCGQFGCAFLLKNDHVLKITRSVGEFKSALAIRNLQKRYEGCEGFATIFDIYPSSGYFFIEREKLEDIPWDNLEWAEMISTSLEEKIEDLVTDGEFENTDDIGEEEVCQFLLTELLGEEPGTDVDQGFFFQIASLWDCALSRGFEFHDLILENLGIDAEGKVKVRDFGYFKAGGL